MAEYRFQTDGSHLTKIPDSHANSRPASTGFGWVLSKSTKGGFSWRKAFKNIDPASNNVAEWLAVVDAVEYALSQLHDATKIVIETDSELVVKQISGEYEIRDKRLKAINAQYLTLSSRLTCPIVVRHIPREQNQMADALSKIGSLLKR